MAHSCVDAFAGTPAQHLVGHGWRDYFVFADHPEVVKRVNTRTLVGTTDKIFPAGFLEPRGFVIDLGSHVTLRRNA